MVRSILWLGLAVLGCFSSVSLAAESPKAKAGTEEPFYTPKQDLDGLKPNTDVKVGLPNVLIIGDSISIGYTKPVVELMKGVANVQRPSANCGDTVLGLKSLDTWLGKTRWDVIHFNWGLHDLCYRNPESKIQGHRDKVHGTQAVSLEQYEKNLETLVERLEKTGAKLIWASTTVVPENEAGRFVGDEVKYNAVAAKVMKRHNIPLDDLYALTAGFAGKFSDGEGNVHYTKEGYAKLAQQVAESVKKEALATKQVDKPQPVAK